MKHAQGKMYFETEKHNLFFFFLLFVDFKTINAMHILYLENKTCTIKAQYIGQKEKKKEE